jgi:Uma2 family endonuclease
MTEAERARVVDALPTSLPIELAPPPEGDPHRKAKQGALDALDDFFRRTGRKIYLSSELAVFYPGERCFVPDVLAVLDVEPHDRMRWVVNVEGKGLDFVLEVHAAGRRVKDHELNVERYARLGIREYFLFDKKHPSRLLAYRLAAGGKTYDRIVPQAGRFASSVLGLDLVLEGDRLRFFVGSSPLEDADERIARLGAMVDRILERETELAEELQEERRAREEERLAREEERRALEEQLAEARAEIERLRKG